MSEIQDKKLRRLTCEQMYVELDISIEDCAKAIGVCDKTIYRWIKAGKWNEKKAETQNLEKQIYLNLRRALNQGLKGFANDPTNKDLQSLVSLLKQFKEQNKPSHAYKDNIIKFLDKTTDFFLEKGKDELASIFKGYVVELAEYLMQRS
jgi:transposase-like protein